MPRRKAPEPTAGSSTVTSATSRRTLRIRSSEVFRCGFQRAAEPARQVRFQGGINQLRNQMHRRIECSAAMPSLRLHHPLEDSPQHVGRHFSLGSVLIHRERETLEQMVEGVSPDGIGNLAPPLALEKVRLKETAIQEGDSPEASSSASRFGATIERAEEQWLKQVAV